MGTYVLSNARSCVKLIPVRILFAFTGGRGHLEPLVPIARAAAAAGHTLAFASAPSLVPTIEQLGFTALPVGKSRPRKPPERIPLREVDLEREEREFRERFAGDGARFRAPLFYALCGDWQPDLVVTEETDFGSMVAAERLGLPYATVLVLAAGSFVRPDLVAATLNELRAEHGLPADPDLEMPVRYLVLSPFPPTFRDPAYPLPATAHSFRPFTPEAVRNDGVPTVYFTLGTEFDLESGDLFERVLSGLRDLTIDVVATLGSRRDPEELGPLPPNVRVERYVPQSTILPRCTAVVSHGGSGTVVGALAFGLPQVVIAMGADQPWNAARCKELGVGLVLDPVTATPDEVRDAVSTILSDPAFRSAADRLRDEIAALPGPEHAVPLLEQLVSPG
jgi:UDP:flavonoid glycosyltransferase YjiC (YdhE family)